ncbi:dUTP diphosphatase [Gemmobacter serpentinus]|uniref:dUTP diphosphatase n=1 Tax=Gemmobacter serpentinus TaxID=2652247 RepID=UPI00124F37C4|nr:dUTP diphosphatase [Gemmobacter serpentinus]
MTADTRIPEVQIIWEDGADRDLPLPSYETPGAAGADLRANLPEADRATGITLAPMERRLIPTGIRIEIPAGYEAQVRPRSGLSLKHGISMPNTPGTIDSDYRGPLGVPVINLGAEPYTLQHGDRIAQMIVVPVVQARFAVVEHLSETARGAGGFGSTGKR